MNYWDNIDVFGELPSQNKLRKNKRKRHFDSKIDKEKTT